MASLQLRIGGMESKRDVQILRAALEGLEGIEAYDVLPGRVRLGYIPQQVSLARIFATLAECGEGYDVELD